jgi:NADPH2:quinone reductase
VRVRVAASGVNPHDVKNRAAWRGVNRYGGAPVIPHSDGAGVIERLGEGVPGERLGQRVLVFGARGGRGTCAEFCVVDAAKAVRCQATWSSSPPRRWAYPAPRRIWRCLRTDPSPGNACWSKAAPVR